MSKSKKHKRLQTKKKQQQKRLHTENLHVVIPNQSTTKVENINSCFLIYCLITQKKPNLVPNQLRPTT